MTVKRHELKDTVLPYVSVDEFKSKTGTDYEVIVVAFYCIDAEPAKELSSFIEKGFLDILDTEVSPNPDEQGHYIVFVELKRNDSFIPVFKELLIDNENVTDKMDWVVSVKEVDGFFKMDDPNLMHWLTLATDPKDVDEFMKESYAFDYFTRAQQMHITDRNITMEFKIVNLGKDVNAQPAPVTEGFYTSPEFRFLQRAFGPAYELVESKGKFYIQKEDTVLVLGK